MHGGGRRPFCDTGGSGLTRACRGASETPSAVSRYSSSGGSARASWRSAATGRTPVDGTSKSGTHWASRAGLSGRAPRWRCSSAGHRTVRLRSSCACSNTRTSMGCCKSPSGLPLANRSTPLCGPAATSHYLRISSATTRPMTSRDTRRFMRATTGPLLHRPRVCISPSR